VPTTGSTSTGYAHFIILVIICSSSMVLIECFRPSCGPQKGTSLRHNACFELLCATIHQRMTSVGEPGKKIKIKIKKKRPYISRISPGASIQPIGTNFWLRVRVVDVINCAKFYRNRLRGSDSLRGRSLTIPIGLRYRR